MSLRILVIDQFPVAEAGWREFLSGTDLELAAFFSDVDSAHQFHDRHRVDVVVLDIDFPLHEVRSFAEWIVSGQLARLVYATSFVTLPKTTLAIRTGAYGLVDKATRREVWIRCLRQVAGGEKLWSPQLLARKTSLNRILEDTFQLGHLTGRQLEILRQVSAGHTNKEVAEVLGISSETVKEHVENILRKLQVNDRTQASVWAVQHRII